jgi:hypothetical protein
MIEACVLYQRVCARGVSVRAQTHFCADARFYSTGTPLTAIAYPCSDVVAVYVASGR